MCKYIKMSQRLVSLNYKNEQYIPLSRRLFMFMFQINNGPTNTEVLFLTNRVMRYRYLYRIYAYIHIYDRYEYRYITVVVGIII